ncbi:MAG: tRNA 2-thiouridine(34) synthase MnmA [Clostridiales bacterium]|nr:tRNA 2-thiouridine(34) synthase MnmA [Clostridiales bacterium]
MKARVVVGMSGGVDSSVTAAILKNEGYDVIGITMQVWPEMESEVREVEGGCCSLSSVNDARRICDILGIRYYVLNFKDIFKKKIIDYFVEEYLSGRTPNPCIACNKYIKFDELLKKAMQLGAEYVATGHYSKIEFDRGLNRYLLKRSVDDKKDQTYVLYGLTQFQLEHTLMPLGNYTKDKVREMAARLNFPVAKKPDSEEICFIPDNDYGKFIKKTRPDNIKPGYFKDKEGRILGRHKGISYYTIGQRKGLGLAFGKPMYVIDIIPEKNTVVLGEERDVFSDRLRAVKLNFIPFDSLKDAMKVTAKIRYGAKEAPAVISPDGKGGVNVKFDTPQRAITPGQSVVFYSGDIVVGGGIIERAD